MLISPHEFAEVFAALTATVTVAWAFVTVVRSVGKRIANRGGTAAPTPSIPADFAARWERLEQSMDSLSIEVERISEAQRFTTRLLSERASTPAVGGGRVSPAEPRRHQSPSGGVPVN